MFFIDPESRVFNCLGEESKKDSGFPLKNLRE